MEINKINFNQNLMLSLELNINIKETDAYTLSSFEELQQQRFAEGMDYYICVVKQNERLYLFDAESFIEDYLRNQRTINPITKQIIEDFDIYVSSMECIEFKIYQNMSEVLLKPNYFPVFWNSPRQPVRSRIYCLLKYAEFFKTRDIEKSIYAYKKASDYGSIAAKLNLARLYSESGNKELAINLLKIVIFSEKIVPKELFCCGKYLDDCEKPDLAFKAFVRAAKMGNCISICEVINRLESGFGIGKNLSKAAKWRQKIPEEWSGSPILNFFNHLKDINYDYNSVSYPK